MKKPLIRALSRINKVMKLLESNPKALQLLELLIKTLLDEALSSVLPIEVLLSLRLLRIVASASPLSKIAWLKVRMKLLQLEKKLLEDINQRMVNKLNDNK